MMKCARRCRVPSIICQAGVNHLGEHHMWGALPKQKSMDLKQIFIMKISINAFGVMKGARGCCVSSIVCRADVNCLD